jgi:predicted transcriptional regulator
MDGSSLTPISCRMGRAALDWSQARLAQESHVAVGVITQFEVGGSRPRRNNCTEIVRVFEQAGVKFLRHGNQVLVLPPLSPVPIAAD